MNTDKIYAEAIVNEYSKKEASKVVALKKLDKAVRTPARVFAISFGTAAALLAGTGMCLAMRVIGGGSAPYMALGVVIGLLGFAGMGVDYPLYRRLLQSRKDRYAGDILRLATEIAGEAED